MSFIAPQGLNKSMLIRTAFKVVTRNGHKAAAFLRAQQALCLFVPISTRLKVVVMRNGHKAAAWLYVQFWLLGEPPEPWENPVPGLSVRVECARKTT